MNVFNWNPVFETGIDLVDAQHRRLVDIINRLGDAFVSSQAQPSLIEGVFEELSGYALLHFSDEERLMVAVGVDPQYFEHHRARHREFVEQLHELWLQRADTRESAAALLGFLASWLTFHILDEDQAMANHVRQLSNPTGNSPAAANQNVADAKANAVLLASMRELYRALADSNARLEVEVRARTRDLLQSEKMAAIGQLAAGVAHEINNPLGFVMSNLATLSHWTRDLLAVVDSCADWCVDRPETAAQFEAISRDRNLPLLRDELGLLVADTQEGLQRVRNIVRALQGFSGNATDEPHEYDLLEGLESTVTVIANVLRDKVELVRELVPLPLVRCVPSAINQVFMNVLLNAVQAIRSKGLITLRSGFTDDDVWVEIADNGCGIPEEHLPRLFEPFFTTKPVGRGMGLGLTTSWDTVVNKHAGRIDVRSVPESGSIFTIRLPRAAPVAEGQLAEGKPAIAVGC